MNKQKIKTMYLDYFNNFLTIGYFAEYYKLNIIQAVKIIELGRKLHNRSIKPC